MCLRGGAWSATPAENEKQQRGEWSDDKADPEPQPGRACPYAGHVGGERQRGYRCYEHQERKPIHRGNSRTISGCAV